MSERTCDKCPLLECGYSFGGHHNSDYYARCSVNREYILRLNLDEAKMLPGDLIVEYWLEHMAPSGEYEQDHNAWTAESLFGDRSLEGVLPAMFGDLNDNSPRAAARAWLLQDHECICSIEAIREHYECYREYVIAQHKKVRTQEQERDRLIDVMRAARNIVRESEGRQK